MNYLLACPLALTLVGNRAGFQSIQGAFYITNSTPVYIELEYGQKVRNIAQTLVIGLRCSMEKNNVYPIMAGNALTMGAILFCFRITELGGSAKEEGVFAQHVTRH